MKQRFLFAFAVAGGFLFGLLADRDRSLSLKTKIIAGLCGIALYVVMG